MSAPEDPQGHVGVDPDEPPAERFRLAQEPDGSVGLTMWDAEGRVRLRLGLDASRCVSPVIRFSAAPVFSHSARIDSKMRLPRRRSGTRST